MTAELFCTVVVAALTSTGLWNYLFQRNTRKSAETELLLGMAHDRIMFLGMEYIERGSLTRAEYENLNKYLYTPYAKLGGNGSAKKIMDTINNLPFKEV